MTKPKAFGRDGVSMAARIAAIPGGYLLVSLICACLARLLPVDRVEAVTVSMLISFLLYALILLWVFAARSVVKLWLWMAAAAMPAGTVLLISLWTGGRL
ncbi:hypothetical protein [Sphingomonas sanxanigenens]|uniref:Iron transporter n=1 Tax=Sphingomonas sanxanigenens DSM 19645 = NX02 TaxID=1123269 RepID=W0A9J6_9SPHN|nr:hypothetical protein [Sphingomonas sanxanigenens]AHE53152.1 hypothetical protein NX02_07125 [Sphingomonas sanxanigenens DSM 19645 = NX02]